MEEKEVVNLLMALEQAYGGGVHDQRKRKLWDVDDDAVAEAIWGKLRHRFGHREWREHGRFVFEGEFKRDVLYRKIWIQVSGEYHLIFEQGGLLRAGPWWAFFVQFVGETQLRIERALGELERGKCERERDEAAFNEKLAMQWSAEMGGESSS